jgi:hypothetical protein
MKPFKYARHRPYKYYSQRTLNEFRHTNDVANSVLKRLKKEGKTGKVHTIVCSCGSRGGCIGNVVMEDK